MEDFLKENENVFGVYLNCNTRNGDMKCFYDYSSEDINKVNFFIHENIGNNFYITELISDRKVSVKNRQINIENKKEKHLFNIYIKTDSNTKETSYQIKPICNTKLLDSLEQFLWHVIDSNEGYTLGENDVLKIGYYKYVVSKIHFKDGYISTNIKDKFLDMPHMSPQLVEQKKCEYCGKIMVKICKCEPYIHLEEIEKWIKDRKISYENKKRNMKNYYFELFYCEEKSEDQKSTCNTLYPLEIKYKDDGEEYKTINLGGLNIEQENKNKNYMVLESVPEKEYGKDSNKYIKSVHIVELTGDPIKIGRNSENDIILRDGTVSNDHAIINYDSKSHKIIIKNMSKHAGTLALLNPKDKCINLTKEPFYFQSNRTYFETNVMSLSNFVKEKLNDNSNYPLFFDSK